MTRPTEMTRSSLPRATPEAGATATTTTKADTTAKRATSTPPGMAALTATAALALTLAGCASPQPNFYTLTDASVTAGSTGGSGTTDASATTGLNAPATPYAIEVSPVAVPDQVDRPQIVVTRGGGRVDILEASRWAAPLKTELTSTISRDLTQRLGAMDVYGVPRADGISVYRVSTSVQRFDSVPGEQAALTAVWSVRKVPGDMVLTCRFTGTEAASGGIAEVVAAQRKLVERLADSIGNAIATSAQGTTPRCQN